MIQSYPTNESNVDFFVLRTVKIDANIRNLLIFLQKIADFLCLAGPIDKNQKAFVWTRALFCFDLIKSVKNSLNGGPIAILYGVHFEVRMANG
ncbi:MAG: hypothetical protein PUB22_02615 [Clostridiales bacterium]|nr:hypothetical protein [Clostridiales bacterium]